MFGWLLRVLVLFRIFVGFFWVCFLLLVVLALLFCVFHYLARVEMERKWYISLPAECRVLLAFQLLKNV